MLAKHFFLVLLGNVFRGCARFEAGHVPSHFNSLDSLAQRRERGGRKKEFFVFFQAHFLTPSLSFSELSFFFRWPPTNPVYVAINIRNDGRRSFPVGR